MKKLILFTTLGFPGSGKTYFARRLAKQFGIVHLNSDKIRSELFKKPRYTLAEHKTVFEEMDKRAGRFLPKGKNVIYDANLTKRRFREKLRNIAVKHGAQYLLLWFQIPVNIAISRILRRKKLKSEFEKKYQVPIDKWVVLRIKKAIEPPTKTEPYVIIDGTKPYKVGVEVIKKVL